MIKKFIRNIFQLLFTAIFFPLKYLIKKGRVVVLSGPNKYLYSDNCRYLYEYLSTDKSLRVYWYTDSIDVKEYLKSKGCLYISLSNPLKLIVILLQTRVIFNSGDSYINLFGIIDNSSVHKICLTHGIGPKFESMACDQYWGKHIKQTHRFDYINFPSSYAVKQIGLKLYKLPKDKIVSLGYPRCDQFYDSESIHQSFKQKNYIKSTLNCDFDLESKFILYTPTWRPYKYNFPILNMDGFEFTKFNNWLKNKNIYFLSTFHLNEMSDEEVEKIKQKSEIYIDENKVIKNNISIKEINNKFERIKMIDKNYQNLFDVNKLMIEIDILLNDYSTTSVDISILNKPQIFFLPDSDIYSKNQDFMENYRNIIPGSEITNYTEFINQLDDIIKNKSKYISKYKSRSESLLDKYLYKKPTCSSRNISNFIQALL